MTAPQRNIVTKITTSRSPHVRGRTIVDVQIRGLGAGFLVVPTLDVPEIVERLSRPVGSIVEVDGDYVVLRIGRPDGKTSKEGGDGHDQRQADPNSGQGRRSDFPF